MRVISAGGLLTECDGSGFPAVEPLEGVGTRKKEENAAPHPRLPPSEQAAAENRNPRLRINGRRTRYTLNTNPHPTEMQ